jgi:PAS domain S-box-containing protein
VKTRLYVAFVTAVAAGLAFTAARVTALGHQPAWETLVLLVGLIATAETLQIRYYRRDKHIDAHNLMEATLAPAILLAGGGGRAVAVCAVGIAIGDFVHRAQLLKGIFNVSQWSAAAAVGSIIFAAVRPASLSDPLTLAALALSLVAVSLVNQLLLSGVLTITGSRQRIAPGSRRAMAFSHTGGVVGNLVVGIALSAAAVLTAWTLLAGFVFVVAAYAASRANLAVRADQVRLEGMQRATHALAMSIDLAHAMPLFLDEVRRGFEVQAAEVVFFGDGSPTVHSCDGSDGVSYRVRATTHELAGLIAASTSEAVRVDVETASAAMGSTMAAAGHRRLLAVPLQRDVTTIGVLLLCDRTGMEGFESGELQIAAALGRELVAFLVRVELQGKIEEERRKLTDILENTSDGILSVDNTGCITSWNAGLVAMTGRAAEEMIGTRHFGLLRPRDAAGRDVLVEIWLAQMASGGALPAELQIVTAEGSTVWLSCSYSRIPAGEGRSDTLVIVARNITQARELERLKDDFVAVVSHELRTPLVPIKGWAQTLLNRGDRLSDDQRRTAVQSILAQAQKLESLVLNILEASRIEAGRVEGEGLADAGAIAARLVEDTLAARPDRSIRLRPAFVPSNVSGSAVWVERAISNLLANAIKYSPDDEPVDVAIDVAGSNVLIAVTDRGPGIAVEAQERIFERFERLEETRKQTGTGLGLYITRRLARAMGGDVTVSSVPGAGSTFLLRLPTAPISSTRLPEPRGSAEPKPNNVVNLR